MSRLLGIIVLFFVTSCKPPEFYGKEVVLYDSEWSKNRAQPASQPAKPPTPVERIFSLQNDLAEIERAIADGLDKDGSLGARRVGLTAEIVELKRIHAEAYEAARQKRLERLR